MGRIYGQSHNAKTGGRKLNSRPIPNIGYKEVTYTRILNIAHRMVTYLSLITPSLMRANGVPGITDIKGKRRYPTRFRTRRIYGVCDRYIPAGGGWWWCWWCVWASLEHSWLQGKVADTWEDTMSCRRRRGRRWSCPPPSSRSG